jgi:prophage DNA circulation protein
MSYASYGTKLRPAWYRGVRFYVEEAGGDYGRRFADHEYAGRDTPYAEPLGRRQRVWPVTGYTIGPTFRLARDALLRACERHGVGELIHPAIGIVEAVCRRVAWSEQREAGLRCTFTLEFAEPGELEEPSATTDFDTVLELAADALGVAAAAAFTEMFGVTGALDYVSGNATADVQNLAATLENGRFPASGYPQAPAVEAIDQLYSEAPGLVFQPPLLCTRTEAAYATYSNAGEPVSIVAAMLELASEYQSGARAVDVRPLASDPPGTQYTSRTRQARNQAAWQRYCRELALREVGYAMPGVPIGSYDEGMALIHRIIAAFDAAEIAAADGGFDAVFIALIRLRAAILADIRGRTQTQVPMVVYRTHTTSNALALAWKFYQDAYRDRELVQAVQAINPAFMPRVGRVKAT